MRANPPDAPPAVRGLHEPSPTLAEALRAAHRAPETELLPTLLPQARLTQAQAGAAQALALRLAQGVRERSHHGALAGRAGLVQGLLQEFSLSSQEGVALMCLAEALAAHPRRCRPATR